jgi:hypothetical protein
LQLWKEFLDASEGGEDQGWSYVTETKGILVHKKQFVNNCEMTCVRGSGVVPIPLEEVFQFVNKRVISM